MDLCLFLSLSPIQLTHESEKFFSQHSQNNNRNIRALFQREIVSILAVMSYLNRFVNDINWKKVWMIPHKHLTVNEVKEVSFRIIHKYYPATHCKVKFKRNMNTNCFLWGPSRNSVAPFLPLFTYREVLARPQQIYHRPR